MVWGYYRIGANAPCDVHLPLSPDSFNALESVKRPVKMIRATPRILRDVEKVSNFIAREKKKTLLGFYHGASLGSDVKLSSLGSDVGRALDKTKLPPQIPTVIARPDIVVPRIRIDIKRDMVDWFTVAKLQAARNYGVYPGVKGLTGKDVPLTTVQMVFDVQQFLFKHTKRQAVGLTANKRRKRIADVASLDATKFFNNSMRNAGIPVQPFDLDYIRLLKTTVIPASIATMFWDNARALAINANAVKGFTALTHFVWVGESIYESARDAALAIAKKTKEVVKKIPSFLKTVLIIMSILVGGFFIFKLIELARGGQVLRITRR